MGFTTSRRLGFSECDPAGIAFYPAYMRLLVDVTEEFFAHANSPWPAMIRDRRVGVPTVKLDVDFKAAAFHGDKLDFTLTVIKLGRSSLELAVHVAVGERTVWTARQILVATNLDTHRAISWPDDLRAGLAAFEETNDV
ncbi:MAG: thioesterase family protein [Ancalomicrobiaceae bacterium]|nr:thioesterase family protein [Ancalomicrobiaceae bacterium]